MPFLLECLTGPLAGRRMAVPPDKPLTFAIRRHGEQVGSVLVEEVGDQCVVTNRSSMPCTVNGQERVRTTLFDDDEVLIGKDRFRVVVADERSPLTPLVTGTPDLFGGGVIEPGTCTIDTLASLGDLLVPFASTYEVSSEGDTTSCFGDDESAFVVSTEVGRGVLVGIAGPAGLTNCLLYTSDAADE